MFGNFLYFIIALLIYATFQPSDQPNFSPGETIGLFISLAGIFYFFSKYGFVRLYKKLENNGYARADHEFSAMVVRQSIFALAIYAFDIYGLNITSYSSNYWLFTLAPTLEALLCITVFVFYLAIVWFNAHGLYERIYGAGIGKAEYVGSNISFSVPVMLPWLLLSASADLINAMPFPLPKTLLATPEGEVAFFLSFLLLVAVTGPVIIQKFWRCKPLEQGIHRVKIESLCTTAGIKYADILYWPIFGGRMITAGVMGLVGRFRYILVTDALLALLKPDEIDAVIAHEIGHVKKFHLLFYLFFLMGYMLLSYAAFDLVIYSIIFAEPLYKFIYRTGIDRTTVTTTLLSIVIILNFIIYFRFIFGYFMRNFERQADAFVYNMIGSASSLVSTFQKIATLSGQSADKPNWHHFSIRERIDFLVQCETDRSLIKRHDRKIKNSIIVFSIGMIIAGIIGFQLNFGETGKRLNSRFFETAILRQMNNTAEKAPLYGMLGDLYYGRNKIPEAVSAYEDSIQLSMDNAAVLNNYAWLLATVEEASFKNPEKALYLAEKASQIEVSPHIMDTLAECYFLNGRFQEAVTAESAALKLAGKGDPYYRKQLERFQRAAEKGGD